MLPAWGRWPGQTGSGVHTRGGGPGGTAGRGQARGRRLGAAGLRHGYRRRWQVAGWPIVSRRANDAHLNLPEPNGRSIVHLFYR
jgi:hypothetical protein